jgi:competence protein ComEC
MAKIATMTVWNVQLGLAIHVKAPNGKYIVIDLGTGTQESGNASPLKKRKYDNIAYMVITHPHLDHIDDILQFDENSPRILHRAKSITNSEVMEGVRDCDKEKFEKYCEINDRYNTPVESNDENNPDNSDNYGGLNIQVFSTSACDHSNFNNFSSIIVFTLSQIKVVVCGDNEKESLDILMQREGFKYAIRNADVLVAPHHGRESAYHTDFVSLVNPRITIISDTNKSQASASDKYTQLSRGWKIENSEGEMVERKCLTTRNDGNIRVEFGESDDPNYYGYLHVKLC